MSGTEKAAVQQLRLVLTVRDLDAAVAFYRDARGLPVVQSWNEPQGAGVVLDAGRATVELIDGAQARFIDEVEVGRPVGGQIRVALQVADSASVAEALVGVGAEQVAAATVTPWNHRNVRLRDPEGIQLTLFTVLGTDESQEAG
jgi:catechol 2,3-dioxygenase-like lactoylglutathione lyase family enzyme